MNKNDGKVAVNRCCEWVFTATLCYFSKGCYVQEDGVFFCKGWGCQFILSSVLPTQGDLFWSIDLRRSGVFRVSIGYPVGQ